MEVKPLKVIYHHLYLTDYPTASCETPDRVSSIMATLREHYEGLTPATATDAEILMVHTESVLRSVKVDPSVYEAAAMAAGGAIMAADLACQGQPTFAAIRPPGHHASPGSYWGFCFFNNMAIAIEKLIRTERITQALVLDIDLHFGDGTDRFFQQRKDVVVANIQDNVREMFLENVERALSSNEYDIVGISAGFDRHQQDWGGTLTTEDYFAIGRSVRDHAISRCTGDITRCWKADTIPRCWVQMRWRSAAVWMWLSRSKLHKTLAASVEASIQRADEDFSRPARAV
jgi:acetoin utilization deacetylase AcuC-like enzyme